MSPVDSASWRDEASRHYRWEAFDLIAAGHHELGVVAAQVHLEAQLRFALRRAAAETDIDEAALRAALASAGEPTRPPACEALVMVLGVDLAACGLTGPLDDHLARVASVLDGAARVTRSEAQASLAAIDALWAEVARAAAASGPRGVEGVESV